MDNKEIGKNIYTYRKANKLTQRALGEIVGKSEATIRKYEKGDIEIPNSVLERLAAALNVNVTQLHNWGNELDDDDVFHGLAPHLIDFIEWKTNFRIVSNRGNIELVPIGDDGESILIDIQELLQMFVEIESFTIFKFNELLIKHK